MALLNLRNAELHSGSTALDELNTSAWMPEYYRLSKLLLDHLGMELEDFFGPEGGEHATQVIEGLANATESDVKERIAEQRRAFENLAAEVQEKLRGGAIPPAIGELNWMRIVECPACGVRNAIKGEISDFDQPRVGDGEIELSARVLPTSYTCRACRLELRNHGEMLRAGLGDQYAVSESRDPMDFYGIDPHDLVDPEDFYAEEYENE